MKIYCTSKNSGPESESIHLIYLGTSIDKATEMVGPFSKYKKDEKAFPTEFLNSFSALPREINFKLLQYYQTDGNWYSVVMFELYEKLIGRDYLTKSVSELNTHPDFSPHARRVALAISEMPTEQLENLDIVKGSNG